MDKTQDSKRKHRNRATDDPISRITWLLKKYWLCLPKCFLLMFSASQKEFLLFKSVNSDKVQLTWHVTMLEVNGHGLGVVSHQGRDLTSGLNSYIHPVHVECRWFMLRCFTCVVITSECGLVLLGKKSLLALASSWQPREGNSEESEYFHFFVMSNSY